MKNNKLSESAVTSHVILAAAQNGVTLWRNNCGAFMDNTGRLVRYGLGNTSPKNQFKSSDYIGFTPVLITPDMIGRILPVFTAVEMKASDFKFNKNDKHLLHQKNFIDIVLKNNGYAGFAPNIAEFNKIIGQKK